MTDVKTDTAVDPWKAPNPTTLTPDDLMHIQASINVFLSDLQRMADNMKRNGRTQELSETEAVISRMTALQYRVEDLHRGGYHMAPIPF